VLVITAYPLWGYVKNRTSWSVNKRTVLLINYARSKIIISIKEKEYNSWNSYIKSTKLSTTAVQDCCGRWKAFLIYTEWIPIGWQKIPAVSSVVTNRALHRHVARVCGVVVLDVSFTIIYRVMFSRGCWRVHFPSSRKSTFC